MAAPKLRNTWGLTGKIETTYGTFDAPVDSDGQLVEEPPIVEETPIHDGSRVGQAPGTGGHITRVAPSGFGSDFRAITEGIGGAAAYSASVKPNVDLFLRICGFQSVGDFTASLEKYTYTLESGPTGWDSASFRNFYDAEVRTIRGAYAGELSIAADGPVVPTWDFGIQGIREAASTDLALPAITGYPVASNLPPKAESIALSINFVTTLIVKGFTLSINRNLAPRSDDNSAGHAGFSPGKRDVSLELVVENIAKATFDPITLRDAATIFATTFTIGSVQYKKWSVTANQCQIMTAEPGEDGPTGLWTITLQLNPTTYAADDELTILYN